MTEVAPHARACCPTAVLRQLSPDELRHLDAFCRRVLDDTEAQPSGDERPAVDKYHALLAERARTLRRRGGD